MSPTLPPAALRPGLHLLRRFVFNPDIPIPRQRARLEAALRATVFTPIGTAVDHVTIGGVRGLRVAYGAVDQGRLVVHLHGGAFCIGSPTMAKAFAARLSKVTDAAVLVPDYRLAPEHPYPAALEDVLTVLSHLGSEQAGTATSSTRPSRPGIALTGDSAGAALAVAACQRLRESAAVVRVLVRQGWPASRGPF